LVQQQFLGYIQLLVPCELDNGMSCTSIVHTSFIIGELSTITFGLLEPLSLENIGGLIEI